MTFFAQKTLEIAQTADLKSLYPELFGLIPRKKSGNTPPHATHLDGVVLLWYWHERLAANVEGRPRVVPHLHAGLATTLKDSNKRRYPPPLKDPKFRVGFLVFLGVKNGSRFGYRLRLGITILGSLQVTSDQCPNRVLF